MTKQTRYIARATQGKGWRIWNRLMKQWWGNYCPDYPVAILQELNGKKRPEKIVQLTKKAK